MAEINFHNVTYLTELIEEKTNLLKTTAFGISFTHASRLLEQGKPFILITFIIIYLRNCACSNVFVSSRLYGFQLELAES